MSEPVPSGTASTANLAKGLSEFRQSDYQDIFEKDSKLEGAEIPALESEDRKTSRRCRFIYIYFRVLFILATTRS